MSTEKLEKAVELPESNKEEKLTGIIIILSSLLVVSALVTFVSVMSCNSAESERERSSELVRKYNAELFKRESREVERLREASDIVSGEFPSLGLNTDASGKAYFDCLKDPRDVVFGPDSLGFSDGYFHPHNPRPISNASDVVIAPGGICEIGSGGVLRITRVFEDSYVLQPTHLEKWLGTLACPDDAYRLVPRDNDMFYSAIIRGCYAKAKAEELGLSASQPAPQP